MSGLMSLNPSWGDLALCALFGVFAVGFVLLFWLKDRWWADRHTALFRESVDRVVAVEQDGVIERTRLLHALQEETELWRSFLKAQDGADYCGMRHGVRQGESVAREPDPNYIADDAEDGLVGRVVTEDQVGEVLGDKWPKAEPQDDGEA